MRETWGDGTEHSWMTHGYVGDHRCWVGCGSIHRDCDPEQGDVCSSCGAECDGDEFSATSICEG